MTSSVTCTPHFQPLLPFDLQMSATVTKKFWSVMARANVLPSAYRVFVASVGRLNKPRSRSAPVARLSSTNDINQKEKREKSLNRSDNLESLSKGSRKEIPFSSPTSGLTSSFTADIKSEIQKNKEKQENAGLNAVFDVSDDNSETDGSTASSAGYLGGVFSYFFPAATADPVQKEDEQQIQCGPTERPPAVAAVPSTSKKQIGLVPRLTRAQIENRTLALAKKLLCAESTASRILRTQEFCSHLLNYPDAKNAVIENGRVVPALLLRLRQARDGDLKWQTRECLSLLGVVSPPRGQGIRILAIDGGGTRGMMGLEILEALEKSCSGARICNLFDYIVGVSTGAIIASLLGGLRYSVHESRQIYMDISRELFSQSRVSGYSGLLISHSYYNTKKWVEILKRMIGEQNTVLETCRLENSPKLGIVACVMNTPQLQPYVFRNYESPVGRDSHYMGGCAHKMWQALQASAAAPGYFEEVILDDSLVLQDGGILINNPTAVGIHEARLLWPDSAIQCVVSVGNGRSLSAPAGDPGAASKVTLTRLQEKIAKIVDSATDTELVHTALRDLLPSTDYFRFNPYMSHPYTLDEIDSGKLGQMQEDARLYVRRNQPKIDAAGRRLSHGRTVVQRFFDRVHFETTVRLRSYNP